MEAKRGTKGKVKLATQALAGIWLILALAFHLAAVGLIGLSVIVFLTAINGVTEEHQIGHAFEEALPFTALLVVFFTHRCRYPRAAPVRTGYQLCHEPAGPFQLAAYYIANGLLSAISDNVFVATVYVSENQDEFHQNLRRHSQYRHERS